MNIVDLVFLLSWFTFGAAQDDKQYTSIDAELIREYVFDFSKCEDIENRDPNNEYEYDYEECAEDNPDVKELIGPDVIRCCGEHGFISKAKCPGGLPGSTKEMFAGVPICVLHDKTSSGRSNLQITAVQKNFCDEGCVYQERITVEGKDITSDSFKRVGNKTFFISENRTEPFCVDFNCHDEESWQLQVIECFCGTSVEINHRASEQVSEDVPLCCPPQSHLEVTESNLFNCVEDKEASSTEDQQKLSTLSSRTVATPTCTWENLAGFQIITDSWVRNSENLTCVGAIKQAGQQRLEVGGVVCKEACEGRRPCLRRCCAEGEIWDESGCTKPDQFKDYFHEMGWSYEVGFSEKPRSQMMTKTLYPLRSCEDRFELDVNTSTIYLVERNETLSYGEFCIVERNLDNMKGRLYMQANVRMDEIEESSANYYHSYILLVSIVCLVATVTVYSILPALLNSYSKIMLNFAISMLVAFLSLTTVKMKSWFAHQYGYVTCKFLGYFNQFSLLAMFTWMTIMSYEIFKQIKGLQHIVGRGNVKQLFKQLMIGYGLPGLIVLLALTVDFSTEGTPEDCQLLRPKFGIVYCSYQYRGEKFFWLLLPILIMLILNTVMFFYIVASICRSQAMKNDFREEGAKRKEKLDKMMLYLRLFFGMGFVWYFEIISFMLDTPNSTWTWIPDILNMLQGVWVFITFVCKRNVINVILRKRNRLYFSLRRSTNGEPVDKVKLSQLRRQEREERERVNSVLSTRISASMMEQSNPATEPEKSSPATEGSNPATEPEKSSPASEGSSPATEKSNPATHGGIQPSHGAGAIQPSDGAGKVQPGDGADGSEYYDTL